MYELGFYIPEDGILHSHCCEDFKSYITERSSHQFRVKVRHEFPFISRVYIARTPTASWLISIVYLHVYLTRKTNKQTPWPLVRERTIPTEWPCILNSPKNSLCLIKHKVKKSIQRTGGRFPHIRNLGINECAWSDVCLRRSIPGKVLFPTEKGAQLAPERWIVETVLEGRK
jgi:hypothetical protein